MSSLHRMQPPAPLRPHSTPSRIRFGRERFPENPRRNGLRIKVSLYRKDWDAEHLNNSMDKETLVSLDVSRRREEQQTLKQNQQKEMESRRVERDSENFNQSVNATNDRYMVDALTKVRKSNVTHPENLTRMNGTWMHNRSFKK